MSGGGVWWVGGDLLGVGGGEERTVLALEAWISRCCLVPFLSLVGGVNRWWESVGVVVVVVVVEDRKMRDERQCRLERCLGGLEGNFTREILIFWWPEATRNFQMPMPTLTAVL